MKGHMPTNEFQNMETPHNDPFNKNIYYIINKNTCMAIGCLTSTIKI